MDIDRKADLHYVFQFGQEYERTGDSAIKAEFDLKFVGDSEAKIKFDDGVKYEKERKSKLH